MTPDANPPHPSSISPEGLSAPAGSRPRELGSVRQTGCCVVGAGPAGAMLALLLARQAVPVMLLEAHGGFDRDFRGDSLHPAIMRVMDELGLAGQLLELPHRKLRHATLPRQPADHVLPTRS
jgi:2-polyprenyl-6-methoxyphenol hydroxylase-like FAD-dependent oxidoreductase